MKHVVIEHVALDELPVAWRARLPVASNARLTVRIEEEVEETNEQAAQASLADNPLFGMWQDREDAADVAAFARRLRIPRYTPDGLHRED